MWAISRMLCEDDNMRRTFRWCTRGKHWTADETRESGSPLTLDIGKPSGDFFLLVKRLLNQPLIQPLTTSSDSIFHRPQGAENVITGVRSHVFALHKWTFIRRVTQRGNWRCNPIIGCILDNSMDCKNWCLIENCAKFIGGDEKVNYAMRQEFLSGKLNNTPNWLLIVERWWCDKGVASAGDWSMTNCWSSSPL